MDPLLAIQIKFYLDRHGTLRSLYEQWRAAYLEAQPPNGGVLNVRFVHDPEWRNNLLSCQVAGDRCRRILRDAVGTERNIFAAIERRTLQWAFDVVAWRAGLVWVDDEV